MFAAACFTAAGNNQFLLLKETDAENDTSFRQE
jgi:hypothetical protein